jgi:hypothetical protein
MSIHVPARAADERKAVLLFAEAVTLKVGSAGRWPRIAISTRPALWAKVKARAAGPVRRTRDPASTQDENGAGSSTEYMMKTQS